MKKIIAGLLLFMPTIVMPMTALAQEDDIFGVNDLNNSGLGTADIKTTVQKILNVILGFLGIIATLIILLGGFKWMTSQGNTDKVDEAKKLIGAGVVGLIIILAAYAIVKFVLTEVYQATQEPE